MKVIRKKPLEEISRASLLQFALTENQNQEFRRGVELFNEGKYWDAHEVWELVWRQREEDGRIFLQGIIQAAAAYYRVTERPSYVGALNNFEKAFTKLEPFPDEFLGVNVESFRRAIVESFEEVKRLGPGKIDEFPIQLLRKLDVL
jgi:predicted metal-dependent hydrolase